MRQEKIWAYFQSETPEIFRGSGYRLNYLARYLRSGQRILNVGIGGAVLERCAKNKGVDIYSLDPDWKSLSNYTADNISHLAAGRLEGIPFADNTFDAVVVSEVLEHLTPEVMYRALQEIRRVLIPGGQIIGTVPCDENLAEATVVCPHCGEVFHKVGHLQSFDVTSMLEVLEQFFVTPSCFERAFMAKENVGWKELSVDLLRNILVRAGVLTRDKQLVFRGRKKS
jgi:SAM-dependent methyltransferase